MSVTSPSLSLSDPRPVPGSLMAVGALALLVLSLAFGLTVPAEGQAPAAVPRVWHHLSGGLAMGLALVAAAPCIR